MAMRDLILNQDQEVTETRKWGMPCFCFRDRMFAYLWTDKKTNEPYILFVEGKFLEHPRLEEGSRARMKILRINPKLDLPIESIHSLLKQALDLYRNGTIKTN